MSADIKQIPPYPEGEVVGACVCGSWPGGKCMRCPLRQRFIRRYEKDAVPESSAIAMQAARYRWLTETIGMRYSPSGGTAIKDLAEMDAVIDAEIAAMQSQQSPVQASDAGRKG